MDCRESDVGGSQCRVVLSNLAERNSFRDKSGHLGDRNAGALEHGLAAEHRRVADDSPSSSDVGDEAVGKGISDGLEFDANDQIARANNQVAVLGVPLARSPALSLDEDAQRGLVLLVEAERKIADEFQKKHVLDAEAVTHGSPGPGRNHHLRPLKSSFRSPCDLLGSGTSAIAAASFSENSRFTGSSEITPCMRI